MHQRIHKGVRPFQCTPCGVFFRQKAHLQKHQKTQGHIQATEIYEKKKREGLLLSPSNQSESGHDSSSNSSISNGKSPLNLPLRPDSVNSNSGLSLLADSSMTLLNKSSSPKRKQAKPSQLLVSDNNNDQEDLVSTSDDKLNAFIDYNDLNHGYDCNQCTFASHDLSTIKDHVRDEHLALEGEEKLKCRECQITFSKEFNLRIHNRKHETSSQFLPCDYCEQVFKVPNKLIKHMEAVHSVCPTCGEKQEDKASLVRHLDEAHDQRPKVGFHANLMQFTPLMSHLSSPTISLENRMAKKRKVDSLAEVIRQKQEQKMTQQTVAEALLNLTPCKPETLKRSENNNTVLMSSLTANLKLLPPTIKLPTKPVAGLTPPSSPPPGQIRGEVQVTIVDNESEDEEEAGLDLTISKRRNSEEEVSSTAAPPPNPPPPNVSDFYSRLALPPVPPTVPSHHLPFPFLPPLPPGTDPALTEHLLKLASLQQRNLSEIKTAPPTSSPYTVLSAMLGHPPPPTPHHYPTVFPGMPTVFPPHAAPPPVATPSSPLPLAVKEEPSTGK